MEGLCSGLWPQLYKATVLQTCEQMHFSANRDIVVGLIFDEGLVIETITLDLQLAALPVALYGSGVNDFPIT